MDAGHFASANDSSLLEHPAQATLAHPRMGYCGVIDERIDLELIAAMADVHPEWQIVMVGPVVKINPEHLPQRSNIHWLGQQSYADLPRFMAGWDVCLLPFALNEATRFISPTKTLEYMAAGRPSVSTRIRDVAEPYGHVVEIADTALAFIAACEVVLAEPQAQQASRRAQMEGIVKATSWDATANAIHAQISALPACRPGARAEAANSDFDAQQLDAVSYSTVVIGAGPTGLAASYHLGKGSLLLEKGDSVGGWCRSIVDNGFTFDYAGHIMFSNDAYVLDLYDKLLGKNVHWQTGKPGFTASRSIPAIRFKARCMACRPKFSRNA